MEENNCINTLFFDLDQASRICRLFGAQNFKKNCKYDLTFDEFLVLNFVTNNPDCCQLDLSFALLKGKSHVSKIVAEMEKKHYIKRFADTKNNRIIKKLELTNTGKIIFQNTENEMRKILTVIEKTIKKEEVESCRAFLRKIKQAVKDTNYIKLT